jgi:hypothetical protein
MHTPNNTDATTAPLRIDIALLLLLSDNYQRRVQNNAVVTLIDNNGPGGI